MATHSSTLAWRIPGMGEPGGLPSMGSRSRTRLERLSSSSSSDYITSSWRLAGGTLSAPFWCLCQKLSLSPLYCNKTLLHKSSEWSSLVSGPGLNSSPPGAKNPGIFAWFNNDLSCTSHSLLACMVSPLKSDNCLIRSPLYKTIFCSFKIYSCLWF